MRKREKKKKEKKNLNKSKIVTQILNIVATHCCKLVLLALSVT